MSEIKHGTLKVCCLHTFFYAVFYNIASDKVIFALLVLRVGLFLDVKRLLENGGQGVLTGSRCGIL